MYSNSSRIHVLILQLMLILTLCIFDGTDTQASLKTSDIEDDIERLQLYEGRYSAGPTALFLVDVVEGKLAITPPFWTSRPYLQEVRTHHFVQAIPHRDNTRTIEFELDETGQVIGLVARNWDSDTRRYVKLVNTARLPIEEILQGNVSLGVDRLKHSKVYQVELAVELALNVLTKYPSQSQTSVQLSQLLLKDFPNSDMLLAVLGYSQLAVNDRPSAIQAFKDALHLNPDNKMARNAYHILTTPEPVNNTGYRELFPYPLADLFKPPTEREVKDVLIDWATRNLQPEHVEHIDSTSITLDQASFDVQIISHSIHGNRHYGAIIKPQNPIAKALPVIVDARGVDPHYTPRDISHGSQLMRLLERHQNKFIYLIPSFRGETLKINGKSYTSEGDRADSWDGATDDMISLLNVALKIELGIDPTRIISYGKSRGGSVALLTAIRDPRVNLALSLAGPVDWFAAMENRFFSTHEILRDALGAGEAIPTTAKGGQFYERYIAPVATGKWRLSDARHNMLASSPVYFIDRLPTTHAYFGTEDRSVPIENARLLADASRKLRRADQAIRVHIYPARGHDVDPFLAYKSMIDALLDSSY